MKKQTNILFYILSIYVILQFLWWGFHLIQLSRESAENESMIFRKTFMIVGEGSVFLLLLVFGLFKISSSIRKELTFSQRKSNFLLSVTHELKTPIASTKLYLQTLMRRELPNEKKEDLLAKALEENERLELLIDNILNASRLDNRALTPIKTEINFNELSNQVMERFKKRYQNLKIVAKNEESVLVSVDEFMLETILTNLIENAVKYAGIDSEITLFSKRINQQIHFGVEDLGPGITDEEKESIFTKFYRSGNEETRQTKGSGLGLYIVSEFVHLHQGKIICKNNSPKGSIFEVTLPL
ncbi:MAG: sensor histidine kinase [Crocinitomicaceae bacterium]